MEGPAGGERIIAHLAIARAGAAQPRDPGRERRSLSIAAAHVQEVFLRLDHGRCLERVFRFEHARVPMAKSVHESDDDRPKEQREQGERPNMFHGPEPTAPTCVTGLEGVA